MMFSTQTLTKENILTYNACLMKKNPIRIILIVLVFTAIVFSVCSCGGKQRSYKWQKGSGWTISRVKAPPSDVKLVVNDRVRVWIDYFTGPGRARFGRYLERSGRYTPVMRQILKEYGLPQDVVYIALIESGFSANAESTASAVGFWQFIGSTGRAYDLRIDTYIDERRNHIKATHAAAKYLKTLHGMFGDWYLAFAGYNAGEGKIKRAIEKYNTADFWKLSAPKNRYLRAETKDYVPKYIAATIIAKNPRKYGFNVKYNDPLEFEYVKVSSQTDFETISKCSRTEFPDIALLNAELLYGVTPPGEKHYEIKVPKGRANIFHKTFAKLPLKSRMVRNIDVGPSYHLVKRGETLSRIARKYKTSTRKLMALNGLRNARHLKNGQKLKIPGKKSKVQYQAVSSDRVRVASAKSKGSKELVKHLIQPGETIGEIALKHGVSEADIIKWNRIRENRIVAGRKLKIYKSGNVGEVATSAETEQAISSAEPVKVTKKSVGLAVYKIKSGDTLWSIAREYKMSVTELCQINNISKTAILKLGTKLKINKDAAVVVSIPQPVVSDRLLLSSNSTPTETLSVKSTSYKVKKGDTLWGIARKHNVTVSDIKTWNDKKNLTKIKPGDTLNLKLASKQKI